MKRFRFRLERLLTIRRYHEREWELKLAEISGICLSLENEIGRIRREKANALHNRYKYGIKEITYLTDTEHYMLRLDQRTKEKQRILAEKTIEREKIQQDYLEASKKRKILDKLKERQAKSYYKEAKEEELKQMDDTNSALFR